MEKLLLRPTEAAERLSIARSRVYEMIAKNELPGVVRIGKSVRLSSQALRQWVEEQANAEKAN